MGRTVQIRGASRDSLVSCLTYMGSDPWANPLVIFQAISYTEKEIVYPAQVMLRQKSAHAVNKHPPDQGGSLGSGIHREDTGQLSNGACGCHQEEKGATPGDDPWVGPLVQC